MDWKIDLRNLAILLVLAFPFGMILYAISADLSSALKAKKKTRIWVAAMYFIVFEALMMGFLSPLRWQSIVVVGIAIPLLGYLAMLGAMRASCRKEHH